MPLKIRVFGRTDKGLVRPQNEDTIHLDMASQVFAVCDGMGGHQSGEIASATAAEVLAVSFEKFSQPILDDPELKLPVTLPLKTELLLKAIRIANRAILYRASREAGQSGMGTTIVAASFEGSLMTIAHVGDSRAYKLHPERIEPLTSDHSWVAELQQAQQLSFEEASSLVGKNVITRALGVHQAVRIDYAVRQVQAGDLFLLCSDGLCGFAEDSEIFQAARGGSNELEAIADRLIALAYDRGGPDNVSVILIAVDATDDSTLRDVPAATLEGESEEQLAASDRWAQRIHALFGTLEREAAVEPEEKTGEIDVAAAEQSGGSPAVLIGIFALFALVAVLVILYYRS